MVEYQLQSGARICAATGRTLAPGEICHSVLIEEGGQLVRKDYGVEAWQGPPAEAVGYWQLRVPLPSGPRKPAFDDDVLMDCFVRLEGRTEQDQINFRYVVALLLMRRKRLKFEDVRVKDGRETMSLRCTRTKSVHEVVNPALGDAETTAVQEEVFRVLGWN